MDYAFLRGLEGKLKIPNVSEVIQNFKPEIVGISVFTYLYDECQRMIDEISQCSNTPIMLGGPHLTIFSEDFINDKRVSYIVRGEAENIILDLITVAKRQSTPVIINCPTPSAEEIPTVNLDIAYGNIYLQNYQIQLSRGCPFNCSFCNIGLIAGRKVRARNLEFCLEQIVVAKKKYPNINTIVITDDCPSFNKQRFKQFLIMFAEKNLGLELIIDNVRADLIDEEILNLYIKAGGQNICLGVESGHPEVFKLVNKGETIDKIINAARLVHDYNLQLGLCFIIGLPEDTLERHVYSIKLAKNLKADYIFWNMCMPWPGTEIHNWFKKNGEIEDVRNCSSLIDSQVNFNLPPAWSPSFTKKDKIKAWLMANLETYTLPILVRRNLRYFLVIINKLFRLARQYNIYKSLLIYMIGFVYYRGRSAIKNRLRKYLWKKMRKRNFK
jgi:radical SAM superfamily enzyme YgiQ (UPF0313 family)